jgi:hypothetical protein
MRDKGVGVGCDVGEVELVNNKLFGGIRLNGAVGSLVAENNLFCNLSVFIYEPDDFISMVNNTYYDKYKLSSQEFISSLEPNAKRRYQGGAWAIEDVPEMWPPMPAPTPDPIPEPIPEVPEDSVIFEDSKIILRVEYK